MDVQLLRTSIYSLPSRQRVGALVYDGSADMQLWPGPGPDSDLREAYGAGLQKALDAELRNTGRAALEIPSVIRVQPGRLHCDFLAWTATRPPEPGAERSAAPGADALEAAVLSALEFVSSRNVLRVAFGALGAGPGELPRAERLAIIVRAANAYAERCAKEGSATTVEEVIICEPLGEVFRKARTMVRGLAEAKEPPPAAKAAAPAKKRATRRTTKSQAPVLPEDGVHAARTSAERYDIRQVYSAGDWFVHPKFGVGRVEEMTQGGHILVLFEDGSQRKMVHAR